MEAAGAVRAAKVMRVIMVSRAVERTVMKGGDGEEDKEGDEDETTMAMRAVKTVT